MKGLTMIHIACMLVISQRLASQESDLIFDGPFNEAGFSEFAASVEKQTGVNFFFRESWVKEVRVTLPGSRFPLVHTLDSILQPFGFQVFLDKWSHLFLTDTTTLLESLPDYRLNVEKDVNGIIAPDDRDVTAAEQKYMNGRKAREPETIHVGSGELVNHGKKVVITGKMSEAESGEPLIGATLYFEDLKKGASTNSDGLFTLVVPTGTYEVECNCMGMEPLWFILIIHSDGDLPLSMKRTLIPLDEVVVRADRYHNVKGIQMGYERLNTTIFKEVPLVMGERDIINVVKLLPGVQSTGEGSAGFNVRGSSADQNMIFINKVPVYNSSHLFGFFTAFSPEIVADFSLYKSNLPASFGGRLASFFDVRTKQGNMKQFSARGGTSSISAYATVESPIRKDKSSIILSARSSYSDWMLRRMNDPLLRNSEAGFNDLSAVYTIIPGEKSRIKVFGYRSRDQFKLGEIHAYGYGNAGASVDVQHRINQRITGNFAMIYADYQFRDNDVQISSAGYEHAYQISHYELKSDFSWQSLHRHQLAFGSSSIYYRLNRGVIEPFGEGSLRKALDLGIENGLENAIFAADEITVTDRLSLSAGLRISSFLPLGPATVRTYIAGMPLLDENVSDSIRFGKGEVMKTYFGLEPRLNLRLLLEKNSSVKLSYNRGNQYLFMLSNTVAIAPSDQWKLCDYHISPQFLDQVSAGFYQDFHRTGLSASLELYRKWGHKIIDFRDGASLTESVYVESESLQGELKAYGIEAMMRKNAGALSGWLTYSYARSIMLINDSGTGEQVNKGTPYPSNFDRPHSAAIVLNYKLSRRVSVSSNMVYMKGRPSTYPVSIYYEYEIPYIHFSDRNRYRIPDYFRLDFSMNMEGNLKRHKLFHSYWMLNVYNLTGRKNAYSVFFKNENGNIKGYKLSIFGQPIITLSLNLKLGNYASE